MPVRLLSEYRPAQTTAAALLVGSFAPMHLGHLASCNAARSVLPPAARIVLTPNRDTYVLQKVGDPLGTTWSAPARLRRICEVLKPEPNDILVDDLSCYDTTVRSITAVALVNITRQLGIDSGDIVLLCGSDQIGSMRPHLANNVCICVLRPGHISPLIDQIHKRWYRDALRKNRLILTERALSHYEPSSSDIRQKQ